MHFADLLEEKIRSVGSPVCVGLDPVVEQIPAEVRAKHHEPLAAVQDFGHGVLRAVVGKAPAVKFQSACYERYGSKGVGVLEEHIGEAVRLGLVVVLDAKRGDIGISATHYAASARRTGAHSITVSGYLGPSGVAPFVDAGLGVFVLVRTSNPDSDEVQGHVLRDGRTVGGMMADLVSHLGAGSIGTRGLSAVGAVVGATKSGEGAALRARMPNTIFLVPGYGAQGGTAEDIRALLRPDGRGVLVTASRSIIFARPEQNESWEAAVGAAAGRLACEIAGVVGAAA